MAIDGNGGSSPVYEPNSLGGPVEDPKTAEKPFPVKGCAKRNHF
jgi:catalase